MVPGREDTRLDSALLVRRTRVGADYFRLLGTRLLRGREFDALDANQAQRVVVINETMAQRFWPEQDPIGRTFRIGAPESARDYAIVGVVQNARVEQVTERPEPHMYLALAQSRQVDATLLVESLGDPLALAQPIRSLVNALDPNVACTEVTTLGLLIQTRTQPQRSAVAVGLLLATLGLVLAALGLYAVMSYSVHRRTHELGVRIALGAQRGDVIGVVMRRGLLLSASACLLGLAGSLLVAPVISGVLYGVPPRDWLSHTLAAVVLLGVAALASYFPARRAAKVDPMVALRCE
jgi:putative ABC transport system permease protein